MNKLVSGISRRGLLRAIPAAFLPGLSGCFRDGLLEDLRAYGESNNLYLAHMRSFGIVLFPMRPDPRYLVDLPKKSFFYGMRVSSSGRLAITVDVNPGATYTAAFTGLRPSTGEILWEETHKDTPLQTASEYSLSPKEDRLAVCSERRWEPPGEKRVYLSEYYIISIRPPHNPALIASSERHDESRLMGWSPTGDRIVLSIGGEVRIYDLAKAAYRAIGKGIHPSWSPDGRWIAWKNMDKGGTRLELSTGKIVEILPGETISHGFQWSPDSHWLLGCYERLHLWGGTSIFVHRVADARNAAVLDMANMMTNRDFGWVIADPNVPLKNLTY